LFIIAGAEQSHNSYFFAPLSTFEDVSVF
jgi:hypothetical protein